MHQATPDTIGRPGNTGKQVVVGKKSMETRFLPKGKSMVSVLILPFVSGTDLANYCEYLMKVHNVPRVVLEQEMRIAEYVKMESNIIESLHELESLPSNADREPLLKAVNYPDRLYRYFGSNVILNQMHDLLVRFYGLYESQKCGGIRMLLLPDISDSNDITPSGNIIFLQRQSVKVSARFTIVEEHGKILLHCESSRLKLPWNDETQAFEVQGHCKIHLQRRTPAF